MPRIRQDNDARYALRASFVDENGDILATPIVIPGGVSGITATQIANWDTAYSWGDHASAGYISNLNASYTITRALAGDWSFVSNGQLESSSGLGQALEVFANNGDDAFMTFHISGDYAVNLGLDGATNRLVYGGWSAGATTYQLWSSQDFANNSANWDTAFGWGDHGVEGYYINGSSTLSATSTIKCGTDGSSPLGFTVNDGGGNCNIVFNHFSNTVQTAGANTARITHNTDSTSGSQMIFSVGDGGAAPSQVFNISSSGLQVNGAGYLRDVTGQYGSIEIDGNGTNGWEGYSIGGRAVFMHDNSTNAGIYNDVNNHWMVLGVLNGETNLYYAGNRKLYTYASGGRVTGTLLATGDVYAYYSDRRLKAITGAIESPLEKIAALNGVYYTHNAKARELGYEGSERQVGLIAQEVQEVLPEVIGRAPVDDDGEGGSVTGEDYITVNYQRIVPLLVEGIKELTAELESVKLELKELRDAS